MLLMLVEPQPVRQPTDQAATSVRPARQDRFTARADSGKRATGIQTRNAKKKRAMAKRYSKVIKSPSWAAENQRSPPAAQ